MARARKPAEPTAADVAAVVLRALAMTYENLDYDTAIGGLSKAMTDLQTVNLRAMANEALARKLLPKG